MNLLTDEERARLTPAELAAADTPIPVADRLQRRVRADSADAQAARGGGTADRCWPTSWRAGKGSRRRQFFRTAAGMAAAYLAMNEVYGPLFQVSRAEAATPELADERAKNLAGQFIFDGHTHFLREDTRLEGFVRMREAVGKAGWNPALADKPQSLEDLKFDNYFKEVFLDSDTKIAIISSAPSDVPQDWFLTNQMTAQARARVNKMTGSRRMLSHAIFTPGSSAGWRRWTVPSRRTSRTPSRATPSATTRTRS